MRAIIRLSLVVAAIAVAACSSTTEPTTSQRQAKNQASHSGYMLAWGDKCDPSADSTCAP